MPLWLQSRAVPAAVAGATILSIAFHGATITAWVIATLPQPNVDAGSIASHVFYLPPPDRTPEAGGKGKRLRFFRGGPNDVGSGAGVRSAGDSDPATHDEPAGASSSGRDSVVFQAGPVSSGVDSVYSVLDVDTAVVRLAASAAPAYPLALLDKHVQGFVEAQYVVDTTGFADTSTFHVLNTTDPGFVTAVREALPYMRFMPAKIGDARVRQLVQQQFSFRIAKDTVLAAANGKRP